MPGDVWILGEHRLLCGDATQMGDVEKVLAGGLADMVFTDPPYNVNYEGKTAKKLKIANDTLGGKFYEFLRDACANMLAVTQGRHLHLHVVVGVAHALPGVHGGRRPLVHVRHLGEAPLHAGPVGLPAAVRADPVRLAQGHGSLLVRRPEPGRRVVHQAADGEPGTTGRRAGAARSPASRLGRSGACGPNGF